jgi:NAD(P)-dependent dehydrogenase (short-subunit alcohol dehydrogenase family)
LAGSRTLFSTCGFVCACMLTLASPHLNMAKAALNMMTKTSGPDYAKDGIYMTSVDTGWLSNEAPVPTAVKIAATHFQTPIDEVDGASRVLDPVFSGMTASDPSRRLCGVFLKDYYVSEW